MKKLISAIILAVLPMAVKAELSMLCFTTVDDTRCFIGIENLSLTIADDVLVATNDVESISFPTASLLSLEFVDELAGISDVATAEVSDPSVTVHAVNGVTIGSFSSLSTAVAALQPGYYVVAKKDGSTLKIRVVK